MMHYRFTITEDSILYSVIRKTTFRSLKKKQWQDVPSFRLCRHLAHLILHIYPLCRRNSGQNNNVAAAENEGFSSLT